MGEQRKALVVGVNQYYKQNIPDLDGPINDARAVVRLLERNEDNSRNFTVKAMYGQQGTATVTRDRLREEVTQLFAGNEDIALFYYAGHGCVANTGGFLVTTECDEGNQGLSLSEVFILANKSKVKNKVVILDCCYSGIAGNVQDWKAELSEGMTILTASTKDQKALEQKNGGVFTNLLLDALGGAAANILGEISPGSVYAHIEQSLGEWDQRPVFKTHVTKFISLRKVQPSIVLMDLQRITEFFPEANSELLLSPEYEPERSESDRGKYPPPEKEKMRNLPFFKNTIA